MTATKPTQSNTRSREARTPAVVEGVGCRFQNAGRELCTLHPSEFKTRDSDELDRIQCATLGTLHICQTFLGARHATQDCWNGELPWAPAWAHVMVEHCCRAGPIDCWQPVPGLWCGSYTRGLLLFFFFITIKPRVE